jgi:hypothetical protein
MEQIRVRKTKQPLQVHHGFVSFLHPKTDINRERERELES